MNGTSPQDRALDLVFILGIGAKGIDGLVEVLLGSVFLVLRPAQITSIARTLTAHELGQDPHDVVANLVLHGAAALGTDAALFAAVYLLVHGLVKVGIVAALFRGSSRVYPWAMGLLGAFLVWQAVELVTNPSMGVAFLAVFDAVIILLTWREWRQGRSLHDAIRSVLPRRIVRRRRTGSIRKRRATMQPGAVRR